MRYSSHIRLGRTVNDVARNYLHGLLCEGLAVDPPLRLQNRLDDISRLVANRDLHGVVLLLDVETSILKSFDDSNTCVESLHALQ